MRQIEALPTVQDRGRNSLERLLAAAERTLESAGLEGATVPAIARRAGMSVGNGYKRFPAKASFFRAANARFSPTRSRPTSLRSIPPNGREFRPPRWFLLW